MRIAAEIERYCCGWILETTGFLYIEFLNKKTEDQRMVTIINFRVEITITIFRITIFTITIFTQFDAKVQ